MASVIRLRGAVPQRNAEPPHAVVEIFASLEALRASRERASAACLLSAAAHLGVVGCLMFLFVFAWEPVLPPPPQDPLLAFFYDPPPPPPPPLPKGSPLGGRRVAPASAPVAPPEMRSEPLLLAAEPTPPPARVDPAPVTGADRLGSATGSEQGVAEGMEEGVEGGVVGGVPGGVLGGVIGGTGRGVVPIFDYDQPPRLLRQVKPTYPQEAFVQKVQGTVVIELWIDTSGRVLRARILESVPLLDAAALVAVRQWLFAPAIQNGRPVATFVHAPVTFRIH